MRKVEKNNNDLKESKMKKVIVKVIENVNVDFIYTYEIEDIEESVNTLIDDIENLEYNSDIYDLLESCKSKFISEEKGKIWSSYPEEMEIKIINKKEKNV